MAQSVSPVPPGYRTVTPHIILDECANAIQFYVKAFAAEPGISMPGPPGKIAHAEIKVGDSIIMMSDEMPPMPGQPGLFKAPKNAGLATAAIFLYVDDVDRWFARAVDAGCTVRTPLVDMFWGDRYAQVIDPYGVTWGLGTHKEDVPPEEMAKRQQAFIVEMQAGAKGRSAGQ